METSTKNCGGIGNGVKMKLKSLLPIGLAGALAFGAAAGEPRGFRNNNPGNIRSNTIKWKGAVGNDGQFVKFATPEDGFRAMARILRTYNAKYKADTVSEIINRWSPPSENPTTNYIDFVAKKLGKKPDDKIDIGNNQELAKLIRAMIEFENGKSKFPYDDATVLRGVEKS